jgi:hypothetical protein
LTAHILFLKKIFQKKPGLRLFPRISGILKIALLIRTGHQQTQNIVFADDDKSSRLLITQLSEK